MLEIIVAIWKKSYTVRKELCIHFNSSLLFISQGGKKGELEKQKSPSGLLVGAEGPESVFSICSQIMV